MSAEMRIRSLGTRGEIGIAPAGRHCSTKKGVAVATLESGDHAVAGGVNPFSSVFTGSS
jgi:hypothetical protein